MQTSNTRENTTAVNNHFPDDVRIQAREWLRAKLRDLEFYQRRGDHYLIREFHKWCAEEHGVEIDEASLGRYVRDDDPVIPTPERCRAFAVVFKMPAIEVMKAVGLVRDDDFSVVAESASACSDGNEATEAAQQKG